MGKFSKLIRGIKEKIFGRGHEAPVSDGDAELSQPKAVKETVQDIVVAKQTVCPKDASRPAVGPLPPATVSGSERPQPYFIQIGFDFGTSFCKCVCRDVMIDKAWIHIPPKFAGQELPFLIPSVLLFKDGRLRRVEQQDIHYPEGGLYHLKHALVKVALGELNDPVLGPYRRACGQDDIVQLPRFVESCAVYFLAGALGTVREEIRHKMPDFGSRPDDYMAVNLAVPIANAQLPEVESLYRGILSEAWSLADQMRGHPSSGLSELESLRNQNRALEDPSVSDACLIYPEVSANIQGFVRSRVSSHGIYLFSDTGAGTVDQSAFIFFRKPDNTEHLTYLHGNVLACGSSQIEFKAARMNSRVDPNPLEYWRERKEHGGSEQELESARNLVAGELTQGTTATLAIAKQKLYSREQINDMRVIFGGGDQSERPYRTSVIKPFSGHLFAPAIQPRVFGLPIPSDLELDNRQSRWMPRLTVAYGLSFEKSELRGFTYPKDVDIPEPDEIWSNHRDLPDFIGKDQC